MNSPTVETYRAATRRRRIIENIIGVISIGAVLIIAVWMWTQYEIATKEAGFRRNIYRNIANP